MIRLRQVKVLVSDDSYDVVRKKVCKKLRVNDSCIKSLIINKKAIDARDKNNVYFVYEVDVSLDNEESILKKVSSKDIFHVSLEKYSYVMEKNSSCHPVIIGSGPAGLFCAYMLAEAGYNPVIIERGECIEDRVLSVESFWNTNVLNVNSNVQFGEGGAGTFSDGKLNTLVKDKEFRMKKVFEIFVSCGAPAEIMYVHNPHIGTDLLRKVVVNMREKIKDMGGSFRYNTCLTDIIVSEGKLEGIVLNALEKISCDVLVLAIGHSARDTFKMLYNRGVDMDSKPFAVGIRIVHPQELINKNQYGSCYKLLDPASYKLTYTTSSGRGVYSFCMCPGGYVVNASSSLNKLVINGMSNNDRGSGFANSAIITTVTKNDFGDGVFAGMEFQEELEKRTYNLLNGLVPVQRYIDFKNNVTSSFSSLSFVKGKYGFGNLNGLFPSYIRDSLIEGIDKFNKKIPGFNSSNVYILGTESRSSSPVRIIRDKELMSNIKGIYPCGEGAGYAGGITTSAIDGIRIAERIGNAKKL